MRSRYGRNHGFRFSFVTGIALFIFITFVAYLFLESGLIFEKSNQFIDENFYFPSLMRLSGVLVTFLFVFILIMKFGSILGKSEDKWALFLIACAKLFQQLGLNLNRHSVSSFFSILFSISAITFISLLGYSVFVPPYCTRPLVISFRDEKKQVLISDSTYQLALGEKTIISVFVQNATSEFQPKLQCTMTYQRDGEFLKKESCMMEVESGIDEIPDRLTAETRLKNCRFTNRDTLTIDRK